MRRCIPACLLLLVVVIATLPLTAQAPTPFSADMKFSGPNGMNTTGKLYFNGSKVRMEMAAQGQSSILISDQSKKVAYMLMPSQHMYMEMNTESAAERRGPSFKMYDPANPCANMPDMTCQKLGTETLNGAVCTKWQFTGTGKNAVSKVTTWIDQKSSIPIKSETPQGSMELSNIQQGAPDASLFEIPSGYRKLDMGNMQRMGRP